MSRLPRSLDELRGLRAARWIRESTPGQFDRFGPDAQREQQDRAIERHGLVDTGISWSVARSGRTVGRSAQFAEMLAGAGVDYDLLLVGYVSRFTRHLKQTLIAVEDHLHPAGAAILFCDERLLSSDPDQWDQLIREAHEAESYSRRLGKRIREGYAAKVRQTRDRPGPLPFGFRRGGDQHTVQPDPATLPAALEVWRLAAAGVADGAIAARTGVSLWRVRGILRSELYLGRLPDGRPTTFPPAIDAQTFELAHANRRGRVRTGGRLRQRTYALTGSGPLVCASCDAPAKGAAKHQRDGSWLTVYRHHAETACPGWPVREVPTAILDDQVEQLLDGARPNRQSEARIRAALAAPVVAPDRLAIARVDARLRSLAAELVAPTRIRRTEDTMAEIETLRAQRAELASCSVDADTVHPDDALEWLSNLGKLWRETSDLGRRALAVATFARLSVTAGAAPRSHRIVEVAATAEAERRGLALALPTRLVVTVVGDTGARPTRVTAPIRIANRREWLAQIRVRSA